MSLDTARFTFFRQGTWMMVAAVASGVFYFAVHLFSKRLSDPEYGVLGTLLQIINWIAIPTLGLQMVIAQQTAASITEAQQRQLRGTVRAVLAALFVLWLALAGAVFLFRHDILAALKIANPAGLWITILAGLALLWFPVLRGVLQGLQNFLWMGIVSILDGAGRFLVAAVIVLFVAGQAAGVMIGVLAGTIAALAIAAWHSRQIWSNPGEPIVWRTWLARVIPLTLGLGAGQFQFSADMIIVQSQFPKEETGAYVAAGTLCRALVAFTAPLVAVMFPKIVRSIARAEKSDVLALTVLSTACLGGTAAAALSLLSPWILPLVFKSSYVAVVPLIRWFAWCMLPLALANVLISNLMARERYAAVPWLVLVAAGYGVALTVFHDSFLTVVKTLGVFNLLLLAVAALFTWPPFRLNVRR